MNLWKNKGWQGILIEYDYKLYQTMLQNIAGSNCIGIHAKVGL